MPAHNAGYATRGSRVRLCKGAYQAPDSVAWRSRGEVDRSYARCMRILLEGPGYPMLATHDPRLIRIAEPGAPVPPRRQARTHDYRFQTDNTCCGAPRA